MKRRIVACTSALTLAVGLVFIGRASRNWAAEPEKSLLLKLANAPPAEFKSVPLPDPKIPGFKFPEDEATVIGWTVKGDQKLIDLHGWGIWTALHMPSGENYLEQPLSVFETWATSQDILTSAATHTPISKLLRVPRPLHALRQLQHLSRGANAGKKASRGTVTGFVKYDPTGEGHITSNGLFKASTLNGFLAAGNSTVPAFPTTTVSLKSVFQPLPDAALVGGRYYRLEAWPGPPSTPASFPSNQWKQWVWVDTQDPGDGPGTGAVDTTGGTDGSSRTAATTYGLGRFVYFRLTAADALALNALRSASQDGPTDVATTGEVSVLLGMHVTSREITRWTWQTYWWTPDPANPPAPSSRAIAADRPAALLQGKSAAKNYAMAIGYDMLSPATPQTGGGDNGTPIYVYNPWLEAGFGPDVLWDSKPWTTGGKNYDNKYGVQTNCMSCHGEAHYPEVLNAGRRQYTADRYVDPNGQQFKGKLGSDFLWSIPDNAR